MTGEVFSREAPMIKRYEIVDNLRSLRRLSRKMMKISEFAFDTETNTLRVAGENSNFICVCITISWGAYDNYYLPIGHRREEDYDRNLKVEDVVSCLQPVFDRKDVTVIGHNLKFDLHVLTRIGFKFRREMKIYDTMLAVWICDENFSKGLKENSMRFFHYSQEHFADVVDSVPKEVKKSFGLKATSKATFDLVLIDDGFSYALEDSYQTWNLYILCLDRVENEGMGDILEKHMFPFLGTLYRMEERGVVIDVPALEKMSVEMAEDIDNLLYELTELLGKEFNPNSSAQLGKILFNYTKDTAKGEILELPTFGFPVLSTTGTGSPQTNAHTLYLLSRKQYKSARKNDGVEFCKKLMEYKQLVKLKSAFIDGLREQVYDDGKAHCSFNQVGADSGRLSCIEENQLVKCMGEDKPIKDVKVGDLVYCYDDSGKLHLRKVLNVIDKGYRECVSIQYVSTGSHDRGSLICTPDHKIRLSNMFWASAESLKSGDKVAHLRRNNFDRPRLYGANNFYAQEQVFIKQEVFNDFDPNHVIHHRDLNKSHNSDLSNLEIMDRSEHTRFHARKLLEEGKLDTYTFCHSPRTYLKGEEHPNYIKVTSDYLEKLVREAKGRIINIPMDFNTFKKKCAEVGFDYKKVAGEYQTQYREVDDSKFTETFYECNGVSYAISKKLGIGRVKVENTIKRLDLCINHKILGVENVGVHHVYDLEVEEYHNFIASEICVHNCSSPNLQQLPNAGDNDKYQIRKLFIGDVDESGVRKKIIACDYANLEIRVNALFSRDKKLLEMFANGDDVHGSTAVQMFELDCKPNECKKKYKALRQAAKVLNFLDQSVA